MKKTLILTLTSTLFLAIGGWAHAAIYKFSSDKGTVDFLAKGHPALISIEGKGQGVNGTLTETAGKLSGDLAFDLNTLDTGIDLRTEHMKKKYLQTDKYPKAVLTFKDLSLPTDLSQSFPFQASIKIHNQTHAITGTAKLDHLDGNQYALHAQFPLKISDYGIGVPSFHGITVSEDVNVKVDSQIIKQ